MFYCVYCGSSFPEHMKFCPYCGKEQPNLEEPAAQTYSAPQQPPVYAAPHTPYSFDPQPVTNRPAKILGNLSFFGGLGAMIFGGLFVLLFLILTLADVGLGSLSVSYEPFSIILGVGAIVLSVLARKKGNDTKRPTLGRIFGIVGIVLGAISIVLFLVFIGNAYDFPDFSDLPL